MTFKEKWLACRRLKNTQLCVGLDPADYGQRDKNTLPKGVHKLNWCLKFIDDIAPHAAAVKINRNFIKDFSRSHTKMICQHIHDHGMISIDDSKLCDVGSSNEAGFYHAAEEGFDAVTYSPFPGNIDEAAMQAHHHGVGIIALLLMSNPQFVSTKKSMINGVPFYDHICDNLVKANVDGVVIGAISPDNHLTRHDLELAEKKLTQQLVLVPGLGEQGGDVSEHLTLFKERAIINVGRSILSAADPREAAKSFRMFG